MTDCPLRLILALCAVSTWAATAAEEVTAPTGAAAQTPGTPSHERAISVRAAKMLAAGLPKAETPEPADGIAAPGPAARGEREQPANTIVHLPPYLVREPRVPTSEDVRTPRGLEVYAMNKYLGAPDGFSRAVLNRFTIADAWKRVPVLGRYPWFSSPEKTAVAMYYDDEHRKKMADLVGLLSIARKPAVTNGAQPASHAVPALQPASGTGDK